MRPGIELATSWFLVGFVTTAPQQGLPGLPFLRCCYIFGLQEEKRLCRCLQAKLDPGFFSVLFLLDTEVFSPFIPKFCLILILVALTYVSPRGLDFLCPFLSVLKTKKPVVFQESEMRSGGPGVPAAVQTLGLDSAEDCPK